MLLLPAPYGYGRGIHISLRGVDSDTLAHVLLSYSCYKQAIPKIKTCLAASGRYDCVVQRSWFQAQFNEVTHALRAIGVEVMRSADEFPVEE